MSGAPAALLTEAAAPSEGCAPLLHRARGESPAPSGSDSSDGLRVRVQALLDHLRRVERKPWHRWGPALVASMGLRQREVALLERENLTERDGRWGLHIRPRPDMRLAADRDRWLPLPSTLESAGFLAFARAQTNGWLFPQLALSRPPGTILEQWVRFRAIDSGDSALRDLRLKHVRQAYVDEVTTRLDAVAVMALLGDSLAEHWSAVAQLLRRSRDPTRLAVAIEALHIPTLDGPVTRWRRNDRPQFVRSGYRPVELDQSPIATQPQGDPA